MTKGTRYAGGKRRMASRTTPRASSRISGSAGCRRSIARSTTPSSRIGLSSLKLRIADRRVDPSFRRRKRRLASRAAIA